MRWSYRFGRHLPALVTAVLYTLTGCGGAQTLTPPSAAQSSWIQPGASSGDLLYAGGSATNDVYVFSYPSGSFVGKIAALAGTLGIQGLCSDTSGNVFVTTLWQKAKEYEPVARIYEYAHGGTTRIGEYDVNGEVPFGCSTDSFGDLAVAANYADGGAGALFVFYLGSHGSQIKSYSSKYINNYYYCAYDAKGNLYVNGAGSGPEMLLGELQRGQYTLRIITTTKYVSVVGMGELQWLGSDLTLEDVAASAIYRLRISGSKASVLGTTHLNGWNDAALSTIAGGSVLIPNGTSGTKIAIWNYPRGGNIRESLTSPSGLFGLTVSVGKQR